MTVKRYTPTQCCEHDGTYVTYSDYQRLVAENAALRVAVDGVNSELYGKGFEVLGWHLNGDTEPLDTWFEGNDWDPETPVTDAAIAEIKSQGVDEWVLSLKGVNGWTVNNAREFAANLRAGRRG